MPDNPSVWSTFAASKYSVNRSEEDELKVAAARARKPKTGDAFGKKFHATCPYCERSRTHGVRCKMKGGIALQP